MVGVLWILFSDSLVWCRNQRPSLSFYVLVRIFILALFGTTLHQNVYYAGLNYTSPTVASALGSVIPAFTFIMAAILRSARQLDLSFLGPSFFLKIDFHNHV